MPAKKTTRYSKKGLVRRYKKRRPLLRKKKTAYTKPYTKISRMPVAERYFTKLNYSELITYTLSLPNTMSNYVFQTSIYDPDFTSTGHQPMWRDTLATMYNRYRVFGIKYTIAIKNTNVSQMTWAYIKHSDNSTSETNPNALRERREGISVMLDSLNGRTNMVRGYLSITKAYGLSKKEFYDDDGFIAAIGANPAKMAYLHIYTLTMNTTAIIHAQVDLQYYVEFMDRIDVGQS